VILQRLLPCANKRLTWHMPPSRRPLPDHMCRFRVYLLSQCPAVEAKTCRGARVLGAAAMNQSDGRAFSLQE